MADQRYPSFFDGNPKMLFTFGIVTGMVLVLLFNSMTGASAAAPRVANTGTPTVNAPTGDSGAPAAAGPLAEVTNKDHVAGDLKKAKVVLVEYSDFECPFCERHHPTMKQIASEYGDQVAWVYRHFPLSFHPQARPAAIASECAAEQGKFWEFGDTLFANQDKLSDSFYKETAKNLGMNTTKFEKCLTSDAAAKAVDEDYQTGLTAGVNGTPATFVNGQLLSGAVPAEQIKALIDAELAK